MERTLLDRIETEDKPDYQKALTRIVRLRQLTTHPFLLEHMRQFQEERAILFHLWDNMIRSSKQRNNVDDLVYYLFSQSKDSREFAVPPVGDALGREPELPFRAHLLGRYDHDEKLKQEPPPIFGNAMGVKPEEMVQMDVSAKIDAVQSLIEKWQQQAPDDKIIIFTQYTMSAKIVGRILQRLKLKYLYYVGTLSQVERNQAVDAFKDAKLNIKVMVSVRLAIRVSQEY